MDECNSGVNDTIRTSPTITESYERERIPDRVRFRSKDQQWYQKLRIRGMTTITTSGSGNRRRSFFGMRSDLLQITLLYTGML